MNRFKTIIIIIAFSPLILIFSIFQFGVHGVKAAWEISRVLVSLFYKGIK